MVSAAPVVTLKHLSKTFRQKGEPVQAVNSVTLKLNEGSFTALVGHSGCGKTTLLRLIAGLESPDEGSVDIHPAGAFPALVFQDPRLLPWLTVQKNLRAALRHRHDLAASKAERERLIDESLTLVGLESRKKAWPHELSGGMAQRAGLARALCQTSGFMLLDEPFSALDAITRERLQKEMKIIWNTTKSTTLFVTHDISEALYLSQRVLVMKDGRIAGDLHRKEWSGMASPEDYIKGIMDSPA
ncbi:MAG: ATP-binding cassette domain-containing protein [Spirochaetales bacterium]|nr:ATP-binding cassette domain-containing protein [Spirochaetales bacterium]